MDRLAASVNRKPTHTDHYIPPENSNGCMCVSVTMYGDKAHQVCHATSKQTELQVRGFPEDLVTKTLSH